MKFKIDTTLKRIYNIDKIILALNDNECEVLKLDAYEG